MGRSRRRKRLWSPVILLSTIAFIANVLLVTTSPANAAPAWSITPTPTPAGASGAGLSAVACISATNCFAVGIQGIPPGSGRRQVIERWNGSSWKIMANPAGSPGSMPLDITCPSAGNCFAVGTRNYKATFAEHWNGSSWTIMAMPPVNTGGLLEGVACATKTSCFAVGRPSIEHWNGHRWSLVSAPSSIAGNLVGITCPSATSCFAVGSRNTSTGSRTVIARWNGRSWSAMTTPAPSHSVEGLGDIACQSTVSCFAVGSYSDTHGDTGFATIYRWDGSHWSRMTPAATPAGDDESGLNGIACPSANSCVAVGSTGRDVSSSQTMVQQWNGRSWTRVSSPNPNGARHAGLNGVACPTAATCLATGGSSFGPLAERYA